MVVSVCLSLIYEYMQYSHSTDHSILSEHCFVMRRERHGKPVSRSVLHCEIQLNVRGCILTTGILPCIDPVHLQRNGTIHTSFLPGTVDMHLFSF